MAHFHINAAAHSRRKEDLRARHLALEPLLQRKARLASGLQEGGSDVRYVEHFPGEQDFALFELCCRHDLKEVVAKARRQHVS